KQVEIDFVGIPKTIDNDVGATESSVGHSTAVMVATEALDRLQPTAASHDRVMILEVMGRDAGHIALAAGIAGGADVILIPEIPYSIEAVAAHIERVRRSRAPRRCGRKAAAGRRGRHIGANRAWPRHLPRGPLNGFRRRRLSALENTREVGCVSCTAVPQWTYKSGRARLNARVVSWS